MDRTIAAISTPQAPGGIGVLRISGPEAIPVADRVFRGVAGKSLHSYKGYRAAFGGVYDCAGEKIDDAVALIFRSPKSYTGEDTVELSCHGGLYVMHRLLEAVLSSGAQMAAPGEFTKRAFLNGKMDLTQAESVMQLVSAGGEQAAKEAAAASDGALSKKLDQLKAALRALTAHLAAWADFPDEDVPQLEDRYLKDELKSIKKSINELINGYKKGKIFREGVTAVIAGKTNAGKSTLMNLLAGQERSIVTQIPGTTRDVVEDTVLLAGIPVCLADTAGIRETADPVEQIGVSRAWRRLEQAQLVLAVFDASLPMNENDRMLLKQLDRRNTIAVINKTDLPVRIETKDIGALLDYMVFISAGEGEGLSALEAAVSKLFQMEDFDPYAGTIYTKRQEADIEDAYAWIQEALSALAGGMTLDAVTICIEEALSALYRLTGERVSEEVVNEVFEQFCVGK